MSHSANDPFSRVQGLIGWVTLAVVLVSVVPLGANRPVSWSLLSLCIWALFLAQVVLSFLRPTAVALLRGIPLMLGFGGVVLWGLVQVYWPAPQALAHPVWQMAPEGAVARIGADPGQGAHIAMRLATYGMIAWIFAVSCLNSERAWQFVQAIAIFSTALAAFGLYAGLTGVNPILGIDTGRPTSVSATFVNRNSYATYAAFGLFANIVVYMRIVGRNVSPDSPSALRNFLENLFSMGWVYLIGVLLCAAAVALSLSRAGGGAALLGILVLSAALYNRGRGSGPLLWGLLSAILGFVALALTSGVIDRLLVTNEEQLRFVVYPVILEQIWERPWLGQGIGAFYDTFRAHLPVEAALAEWNLAHNTYLENIYELGIPAAALLYLVLLMVLIGLLRGLRVRSTDTGLPALALACMVTGGFHAVFDFSLQMPAAAALFAALLGLGWSQSFTRKDRTVQRKSSRDAL